MIPLHFSFHIFLTILQINIVKINIVRRKVMYTYLYAVKFLYKENYHCVSIIINNEKKIPGNTIEKRLKHILEQVRFKNVTYFEVIEEITQEKVKGIISPFSPIKYEYLKTVIRKNEKGKYEIKYYDGPNLNIFNTVLGKKMNIYNYYAGYGLYQEYCKHTASDEFGRYYFIDDVVTNVFSLKDADGKSDYKSLKSIVQDNPNTQFVFLFPSFLDIDDLHTILETYIDCINLDVYVVSIRNYLNTLNNTYRKASLDGDRITLREVFLS